MTTVANLISESVAIIEATVEDHITVHEDESLREVFHEAGRGLQLVKEALEMVRTRLHGHNMTEHSMSLIKSCKTKAELSEEIVRHVARGPSTSRSLSYKAALQQKSGGKSVENLTVGMMDDMCHLAQNMKAEKALDNLVGRLRVAMAKLSAMEPSMPNEGRGQNFHSYNESRQYNAPGGTQNNNSTGGNQFPGAFFSGPINFGTASR